MRNLTKKKQNKSAIGSWILTIAVSLVITASLAPLAIWISIEKNEILFTARKLQNELDKKFELTAKLEVEHTSLLSPYELEKKADEIGMGIASSGQVRRLKIRNSLHDERPSSTITDNQ